MNKNLDKTCLCIDLRAAAQTLTSLYDSALAPSGITVTQFSLMHLILRLEGPTLTALSEASQLDRSTLGRNIRVLEKSGLVAMKKGSDARSKNIQVTRKGKNALERAFPLWQNVQNELTDKLGRNRREQLHEMLEDLTA